MESLFLPWDKNKVIMTAYLNDRNNSTTAIFYISQIWVLNMQSKIVTF